MLPTHRAHAQASEFFDDFFSDNLGQPAQNFRTFIQWNVTDPADVTNSSVDFVGGNVLGAFPYPQGRFVDLGGSTGAPALFSTKAPIVLVPGVSYTLSFRYVSTEALLALGGPGADTLTTPTPDGPLDTARATLGGASFTFSTTSSDVNNAFSVNFIASAATVLTFQDLGFTDPVTGATRFDNSGVGIDGVLVAPTVIPEPRSLALITSAILAAVGSAALRRRQPRAT